MSRISPLLILLLTVAINAQAQVDTRIALRFSAGWHFPTSPADLSDNWKSGPGYAFDFEYPVENGEVSILGSYHSASFPFDKPGFLANYDKSQGPTIISSVQGPDASLWGITVGGKLNGGSDRALFYLRFDLGYFSLSRGNVIVSGPGKVNSVEFISKTGTLINIGLGAEFQIAPPFSLFLEGNYFWAKSQQDEPTGYTIFYSTGGSETERKNTWIGGVKAGVSVRI